MNVKELMEYPKIRELLKKYWDNDEVSGEFDTDSMSDLDDGFSWQDDTEEGYDFWNTLHDHSLEHCKEEYPEYFVKEEETPLKGSNVDIEHLRQWPKLYERAKPLSLAARIITSSTKEYNGHAQLEVTFKPSLEELTTLVNELDNYYTQIDINQSVYAIIESDGSGSINVSNFWNKKRGSPSGKHKDKLIFSFGAKK